MLYNIIKRVKVGYVYLKLKITAGVWYLWKSTEEKMLCRKMKKRSVMLLEVVKGLPQK